MNTRIISIQKGERHERMRVQSARETQERAKHLLKELRGGDVLALSGEVGAGKTTFTQGIALALGVKDTITSPTFVLMKIYKLPAPLNGIAYLCHIDTYRLESADELRALGAEEYIGRSDTLTVIEWPEKVKKLLPAKAIWISFEHSDTVRGSVSR